MKKFTIGSLAAVAALLAGTVHAEGLYIGADVGSSHYKGGNVDGQGITDPSSTAVKLYGGYSFNPYLGVEAGYVDLGRFRSSAGRLKGNGAFVDAVGTLPLGNDFSALARVGVFNGKLDSDGIGSDRGTNIKVGAGLQYDISKAVGVRAQWERYRFDALDTKANTDVYSLGVNYRF